MMIQAESATVFYSLYGQLLESQRLFNAWEKVRKNKGAPGIDHQSCQDFEANLYPNLKQIQNELKDKSYQAKAVKRVEIDKADGTKRLIGIPTVKDRIVQQVLKALLSPIFETEFHQNSYGYRPRRSAGQAISRATHLIRQHGKHHVVDLDLSRCFDTLNHQLIITAVKKRVTDSSVLGLIEQFLKSGVMVSGNWQTSETGSPQGGVISPLLANIYLNAFDQNMAARGHHLVRYADDILILCGSKSAAQHAYKTAKYLLEETLKLEVNLNKSQISHISRGIKYLSIVIGRKYSWVGKEKQRSFKAKIKQCTVRNGGKPLVKVIAELNRILRGWVNYFRTANIKSLLKRIASWVRRRLRAIQLKLWKRPGKLHRKLKQRDYKPPFAHIKMNSWRNSSCPLAHYAMPNQWFIELGLFNLEKVKSGRLVPEKRLNLLG